MKEQYIIDPPNHRSQLGQLLLFLADDVLDAVNRALEDYQISESKLSLLLILVANDQSKILQPSEIADKLGIRRASVTKQLNWLEEHQFIVRTINKEDQRMVNVTIAAKGHQLLHQVMPIYWRTCDELTEKLTDEEAALLLTLLKKIHR